MTYIAFIGIDGAGKTTVINRIQDSGYNAVFTREPYYPEFLTTLKGLDDIERAYEFAKDRYLHMKDVVIPAKKEGKNIISDRSYLCSLAYQSYAGIDAQWLMHLQPENLVFPDHVIWFQCDPDIAALRSGENAAMLRDIQRSYGLILNSYELPAISWHPVITGGKTPDEVYAEVALLIHELDEKRKR